MKTPPRESVRPANASSEAYQQSRVCVPLTGQQIRGFRNIDIDSGFYCALTWGNVREETYPELSAITFVTSNEPQLNA
jgi:hypothetical protein